MAKITLNKFEVAQMFGLEFDGVREGVDEYGNRTWYYKYSFHGCTFEFEESYYSCDREGADELAAEKVLNTIGKIAAGLKDF